MEKTEEESTIYLQESPYKLYMWSFIIPLLGVLAGAFIGHNISAGIGLFIGMVIGMMTGGILAIVVYDGIGESNYIPLPGKPPTDKKNELVEYYYKQMKETLDFRLLAARRLQMNSFWIRTINIYYSCFTAVIAILSLRDDAQKLTVSSAIFTVVVAILVTYANSQGYDHRASDLKANCIDIRKSLTECISLNGPFKTDTSKEQLDSIISEYTKKLGDSEDHSVVDEWQYKGGSDGRFQTIYWFCYRLPVIILVGFFFIIPVWFVYDNLGVFVTILGLN